MEIIANAVQTVQANQNVLFTDTVVGCSNSLLHRRGSGLVTLKGNTTTQCRARYRITFSGNIAIATGGTADPISLAIAINGEGVAASAMISTPATTGEYNNVSSSIFVDVPRGCCFEVAVKNLSTQAIDVQNANLIIERVA